MRDEEILEALNGRVEFDAASRQWLYENENHVWCRVGITKIRLFLFSLLRDEKSVSRALKIVRRAVAPASEPQK